jgi:hypothetical protein
MSRRLVCESVVIRRVKSGARQDASSKPLKAYTVLGQNSTRFFAFTRYPLS